MTIETRSAAEARVIADVLAERAAQDAKWGEQNHPDGTGHSTAPLEDHECLSVDMDAAALAELFRDRTESRFAGAGWVPGAWRDILLEEVFEALAEEDPDALRYELIQVAAVASQWAQAIDRRAGAEVTP